MIYESDAGTAGSIGRVHVDEVDVMSLDERPQPADPRRPAGAIEARHLEARMLEVIHERVLPRNKVGNLVVELSAAKIGRSIEEELLGSAATKPFDEMEYLLHP
jgi:hypothetical protein